MKKLGLFLTLAIAAQSAHAYIQTPFPTGKGGTGTATQTAHKAVTTDASGHVVSTSSTTDTEVGYLAGVTAPIQGQINAISAGSGITALTGDVSAGPGSGSQGATVNTVGGISAANINTWLTGTTSNLQTQINGKEPTQTKGTISSGQTGIVTIGNGTSSTVGPNVSITVATATTSATGLLTSTDWNTFNGKQAAKKSVADAGDADYTVLAGDNHVRTSTTLTGAHAINLPACTAGNIGEWHEVKNTTSQTFNETVTPAGSDTLDGGATYVMAPGDGFTFTCGAFGAGVGTWDIGG